MCRWPHLSVAKFESRSSPMRFATQMYTHRRAKTPRASSHQSSATKPPLSSKMSARALPTISQEISLSHAILLSAADGTAYSASLPPRIFALECAHPRARASCQTAHPAFLQWMAKLSTTSWAAPRSPSTPSCAQYRLQKSTRHLTRRRCACSDAESLQAGAPL